MKISPPINTILPVCGNANASQNISERFDGVIRKAKLLNNHLLLENNSIVANLEHDDGRFSYALAVSNPNYEYVGVLKDKETVSSAINKFDLSNLKFIDEDLFFNISTKSNFDGIILSDILYKIYNDSNYSKEAVNNFIKKCFFKLKREGQLVVRDYSVTNFDELVNLEIPYYKNRNEDVETLLNFIDGNGYDGIQELESDKTYTRLFQMPYYVAYDFLLGKDKLDIAPNKSWRLIAYSSSEYKGVIEELEGRLLYTVMHRDEAYSKKFFYERFQLFSPEGINLGLPPTSFIMVAQKKKKNESLYLFEKEKTKKKPEKLTVSAVVDEKNGNLFEVVRRNNIESDIIPYRITSRGTLNIFLTESTPHGIANTASSIGSNLDHRQWSGHMIDAVKLEAEDVQIYKNQSEHEVRQLIYDTHKIVTACGSSLEKGPSLYPAPDYIDELRECYYIQVCQNYSCAKCLELIDKSHSDSKTRPLLRELDAQNVLNAINVGLIPNSLLETQIVFLMKELSIKVNTETEANIPLDKAEPKRKLGKRELISFLSNNKPRFKETRERTGAINITRSNFVDKGKVGEALININSHEDDFVSFSNEIINTALVVPLTRDLGGEILVGFEATFLPVPERFTGTAASLAAPTFPLPKEVTNFHLAKEYVAKQFKVTEDRVGKLGESYFTQIDMTPHRIYPFVVATAAFDRQGWGSEEDGFTGYTPLDDIIKLLYWDNTKCLMVLSARLMTRWCQDSDLSMGAKFNKSLVSEKISNLNNAQDVSTPSRNNDSASFRHAK